MELRDGDLVLRPWTEDDVDAMVAGCNDPEVAQLDPDDSASVHGGGRARLHSRRGAAGAPRAFAIELDGRRRRRDRNGPELARVSGDDRATGSLLCTRARASARVRFGYSRGHALDELELQRVDLVTDPDNVASQRVAEKVGFQREGVLRAHLRHPDGRIRDSVMFSLLPGELRE